MYEGIKTRYLSSLRPIGNEAGVVLARMNACGRPWCKKCPHGPYYYLRTSSRRKRKTRDTYLGSEKSDRVQAYLHARFAEQARAGQMV